MVSSNIRIVLFVSALWNTQFGSLTSHIFETISSSSFPKFPVEFVSGNAANFYETETDITYVSQTIQELPSYYSLSYDPTDGRFTTLILKGHAKGCEVENE